MILFPQNPQVVRKIVFQVIVVHLATLSFLLLAHSVLEGRVSSVQHFLDLGFYHWDVRHYLAIAENSYAGKPILIVFFPLFPALIFLGQFFFGSPMVAALALNFACHILAGLLLYQIFLDFGSEEKADRAFLLFLIFPTSFSMVIPYTESLFLVVFLLSLRLFQGRLFFWAAVLAFFAALSRPPAIALVAFFMAEYWFEMAKDTPIRKVLVPIAFYFLGLSVYLGINYYYYSDPFFFMKIHRVIFKKYLTFPHVGFLQIFEYWNIKKFNMFFTMGLTEPLGTALAWATTVYAYFRLRKGYGVYCLVSSVLLTFQSKWQSNLRYCFVLFPMFLMVADWSTTTRRRWLVISICLVLFATLSLLFSSGHWSI